jgi:hypothetical protein
MLVTAAGCGTDCRRGDDGPPLRFDGGNSPAAGFYETSPAAGPYLDFPSGRRWELVHGLGAVPSTAAYLSFQRCPLEVPCEPGDEERGGYAEAAGNAVVFENATEEVVVLRNDTCADFFLRVELRAP